MVHSTTAGVSPKTWFRGKDPVDEIWVSSEIYGIGASYLRYDADISDHRPVVVDLTMSLVLRKHRRNTVLLQARRLTSKVKCIRQEYTAKLEDLFLEHGTYNKLSRLASIRRGCLCIGR